ncbi:MAG: hypothetical protein V4562_11425 [Pseudomonadota bacterium]
MVSSDDLPGNDSALPLAANDALENPAPSAVSHLSTPLLAQLMGSELLAPLTTMQGIVDAFAESRTFSLEQAQQLQNAIYKARALAQRVQKIGKLLGQDLALTREIVDLDEQAHAVLDDCSGLFDELEVRVRSTIRPAKIVGDPQLVRELIQSVVDWSLEGGRVISIVVQPMEDPPHPALLATIRHQPNPDGTPNSRALHNSLSWQLVQQLTQVMGLALNRVQVDEGFVLTVDFPSMPDNFEVLTLEGADRKPWWSEE